MMVATILPVILLVGSLSVSVPTPLDTVHVEVAPVILTVEGKVYPVSAVNFNVDVPANIILVGF